MYRFGKIHRKTPVSVSFLLNYRPEACNFIKKENLALVFFCEFCEIFNNTYFEEHMQTAASVY